MLTASEVKSIVATGEGYNAEFKLNIPSKVREISEEVCAFANASGGVVLIGVNDHNQIVGTDINNSRRSSLQNSLDEITPPLASSFYVVEVDGKKVGVIDVKAGLRKPYILSGAIYVRKGPNSQKLLTQEEIFQFYQECDSIHFDEASCPDYDFEDNIDLGFLQEFRQKANLTAGISNEQVLANLSLYNKDHVIKRGAVLFFSKAPERVYDTAVVRCVAFRGTDKVHIIDDKTYGGPLYMQYWQAMEWLKQKLSVRYIIEGSGPRKELYELPENALKELIINAICSLSAWIW